MMGHLRRAVGLYVKDQHAVPAYAGRESHAELASSVRNV
jgi:hypothetical protein